MKDQEIILMNEKLMKVLGLEDISNLVTEAVIIIKPGTLPKVIVTKLISDTEEEDQIFELRRVG